MSAIYDDLDHEITPTHTRKAVAFSDTVEFKMADPLAANVTDRGEKYCKGFSVNDNGTLSYTDPGDTTVHTQYCNKGTYYPYAIGKFMPTGTDAALKAANAMNAHR